MHHPKRTFKGSPGRHRASPRSLLLPVATLLAFPALIHAQNAAPESFPFKNPSLPTNQRLDDLLQRMTLEEKVGQMMNESPAIPRLGIPAYDWWSEGLHGIARSGYSTLFPQAIGMAATWDRALVHQEADVISLEARAKYNVASAAGNYGRYFGLTIWSPNINIFRDPRWGRGQETYGEDPFLTATLGTAFVQGLQPRDGAFLRTIATPKHYAVHSGPESTRHTADVDPSPYDLEATYLPAFRATVVDGHAQSLMCAYNAVDGLPACASTMLLDTTLRQSWRFGGFVTSDCGAVDDFFTGHKTSPDAEHAAATAVLAGTDTNCGGTYKALVGAVHDNLLPEKAIDTAVRRLFAARIELGMFDPPAQVPYSRLASAEVDTPEHRALAERAAREAMVLLKNQGNTLPLKPGIRTIAVVGPSAASLLALEGNYNAIPSHPVLPVDGIAAAFRSAEVVYAQGSPFADGVELPVPRTLFRTASGEEGLTGRYFAGDSATPVLTRTDKQIDFDWTDASPVPGLPEDNYTVRWSGTITPPRPGSYQLGLRVGRCNDFCDGLTGAARETEGIAVTLDGKAVDLARHTPGGDGWGFITPEIDLQASDGKPHSITIEYRHHNPKTAATVSLRWLAPAAAELEQAVAAARHADVTVAFVGLTSELEGEEMAVHIEGFSGGDRTSIQLPAPQQHLLDALAATGKPLVVVLMSGSALAVDTGNAILEAWYPGEAGGTAIAATLAGENNPGGRLPVTFYASTADLPAFESYSMRNRTYRYFMGQPLYGFGYGLSYTSFAYSGLKLSSSTLQAGDALTVAAEVRNTGSVPGDEVAELYLLPPKTELSPQRALVGFHRVHLAPGESKQVEFALGPRQLSVVDAQGNRSMSAGSYALSLGGGQPGAAQNLTGTFTIIGERPLPK